MAEGRVTAVYPTPLLHGHVPIEPHTHLIGHGEGQGAGLYEEEGVVVQHPCCISVETGRGHTCVRVNPSYNLLLLGHDLSKTPSYNLSLGT